MTHPLKVYYTKPGHLFLLQWWSHNEQCQIILARTEAQVIDIAKKLFLEHGDAEVKNYIEIELVSPPYDLCQQATAFARQELVDKFHQDVAYSLIDVFKMGEPLPDIFVRCINYDTGYENDSHNEYAIKEHWGCLNCKCGFQLFGITPEELYDRYSQVWAEQHHRKVYNGVYKDPVAGYSQAPIATNIEGLWVASTEFGPHAKGVALNLLDPKHNNIEPVLFYYHLINELDLTPFKNMLAALKIERKQKEKELAEAKAKTKAFEQQENVRRTLECFKQRK